MRDSMGKKLFVPGGRIFYAVCGHERVGMRFQPAYLIHDGPSTFSPMVDHKWCPPGDETFATADEARDAAIALATKAVDAHQHGFPAHGA